MTDLFFSNIQEIYQVATSRLQALEEQSFEWLDGILESAKKAFKEDDICLLPKTPSAKPKPKRERKKVEKVSPRRKIFSEEKDQETENKKTRGAKKRVLSDADDDDFVTPDEVKSRGAKKRIQSEVVLSDVDDFVTPSNDAKMSENDESEEENKPPVRQTRATRANTRGATTSRAKNTRNANKSRAAKKIKSADLIKNLEEDIRKAGTKKKKSEEDLTTNKKSSMSSPPLEQPAASDGEMNSESHMKTESVNSVQCMKVGSEVIESSQSGEKESTALKNQKKTDRKSTNRTPVHNLGGTHVKEIVRAYEVQVLLSPLQGKKRSNSVGKTPENSKLETERVQKTPDTVVTRKTKSVIEPETPYDYYEEIIIEEIPALPGVGPEGFPSEKKVSPRVSQTRRSVRTSKRKSLKMLQTKIKEISLHTQVDEKTVRSSTRLRLKKDQGDKSDHSADGESEEPVEVDSEEPVSETETKTDEEHESHSQNKEQTGKVESSTNDNSEQDMEVAAKSSSQDIPRKLRSSQTGVNDAKLQQTKDSGMGGSTGSSEMEELPRCTRSKMRKPTSSEEETSEPRTTRTKTRKRQLEEESAPERSQPKRSRSCFNQDMVSSDKDKTPKRKSSGASCTESSDGDVTSPNCPPNKVVRPHPTSFLNKLKPLSTKITPVSSINPGLVTSFIARNSPMKRPTAKEIQEKKKQELQEKEKKLRELQKKREEEQKKKMEAFRKKREEKAKKVQEAREQREKIERENRLNLEKKMAEKKQFTNKLKEEKMKEEKEKQRLRQQKVEEAEERRKHEEEERKKRLHEQMEHEKFQAEFMQRKKEFEEQERLKKMEEEKHKALERHNELEKERERERQRLAKFQAAEAEKQKEWLKQKEERERLIAKEKAEREKVELEKKRERDLQLKREMERLKEEEKLRQAEKDRIREQQKKQDLELKKMVEKHNNQMNNQQKQQKELPKPNLNKTHSLTEPTVSQNKNDSYEMTPDRVHKPATDENYGIDDIKSDDETDDDEAPRKKIPEWATGVQLKALLIKQHLHPPNLDYIFGMIEPPDLNMMFEKKRARFNKRTSSAHWDTPIIQPGLFGRM